MGANKPTSTVSPPSLAPRKATVQREMPVQLGPQKTSNGLGSPKHSQRLVDETVKPNMADGSSVRPATRVFHTMVNGAKLNGVKLGNLAVRARTRLASRTT